jgi:hypothetical protein
MKPFLQRKFFLFRKVEIKAKTTSRKKKTNYHHLALFVYWLGMRGDVGAGTENIK